MTWIFRGPTGKQFVPATADRTRGGGHRARGQKQVKLSNREKKLVSNQPNRHYKQKRFPVDGTMKSGINHRLKEELRWNRCSSSFLLFFLYSSAISAEHREGAGSGEAGGSQLQTGKSPSRATKTITKVIKCASMHTDGTSQAHALTEAA